MFSDDAKVNKLISETILILSFFLFFDCMQQVIVGMIRALGKQGIASFAAVIAFWIIGIPMSLYFVFVLQKGLKGLWYGPTTSVILLCFL